MGANTLKFPVLAWLSSQRGPVAQLWWEDGTHMRDQRKIEYLAVHQLTIEEASTIPLCKLMLKYPAPVNEDEPEEKEKLTQPIQNKPVVCRLNPQVKKEHGNE